MPIIRLLILLLAFGCAEAAAAPYPCDLTPAPKLCFGMKKMRSVYSGDIITVQKQSATTSTIVGLSGDDFDAAALYTFLSGEAYGRVLQWHDQSGNAKHAACPLSGGACALAGPNIQATSGRGVAIGGTPALSFQGGSNSGAVYGLPITGLTSLGLSPRDYTIFAVLRPTSSAFRNQQRTPDTANGTYLSIEGGAPIDITGDTVAGNPVITNVPSTAGISAGMVVQSPNPGPFVNPAVVQSTTATTITLFGANAGTTTTAGSLVVANPLVQVYANGENNPGSISVTDNGTFSLAPTDTAIETGPVVLAVTSDSTGVKQWQDEVVRSTALRSAITTTPDRAYIGQFGGSIAGSGYSRSGDFWIVALMVYDGALTQAQRAAVASSLYQTYGIQQAPSRSRPSAVNIVSAGDSIGSGYITGSNGQAPSPTLGGLRSYSHLLGDALPAVRFLNYSVPGIQATASVGTPPHAFIEGMMPTIVAPSLSYSKAKNILLVFSAGGNDMVSSTAETTVTFETGTSRVGWTAHGLPVNARVKFVNNGDTLPTPLVCYPCAYSAVYFVKSVPNANEFTLSATPGGTQITLGGSPSGTHRAIGLPKTAASIYAGLLSIVSQGLTAGAAKVFVCTLPPRVGGEYIGILDELNALILAGAGGAGGNPLYTAIDTGAAAALHPNPNPPNTFTPGTAYWDSGHGNDIFQQAVFAVMHPVLSSEPCLRRLRPTRPRRRLHTSRGRRSGVRSGCDRERRAA
jgi:hypothetical protein